MAWRFTCLVLLGLAPVAFAGGGDYLSAPQLAQTPSLGLGDNSLLGRYGLTADAVLKELAPHLSACTTRLVHAEGHGRAVHEIYELRFGPWPVAGAYIQLHHFENRLAMVRASLPEFRLPPEPPTEAEFLPLASLGFSDAEGAPRSHTRRVVADFGGLPGAAWEVTDEDGGLARTRLIEAQTGALLAEETTAFDVAQVYKKGPTDGALADVELPDLPGTGYLDGKHIAVFAPSAGDPRVMAPDGTYDFLPNDPADQLRFDQVQAYYGATRALSWFSTKFGFVLPSRVLPVRVNFDFAGQGNGGAYVPPPIGPEIRLGGDGADMTNLARDTDVVSHELSHHVIYQHLKSSSGESGIVHEGTADYFAYALNGDPNLGESVVPGKAYLRTAALDSGDLYDQLPEGTSAHEAGQHWSAVLWDLRQTFGDDVDALVYGSLAYLGPHSGLSDAFLALVNADRDLFPLPADAPAAGVFGAHQCAILDAGVKRGFAVNLEHLSGDGCGLDLSALAAQSRLRKETLAQGGKKGVSVTLFGRTCGVVPHHLFSQFSWLSLLLAGMPLFLSLVQSRQGGLRGSRE